MINSLFEQNLTRTIFTLDLRTPQIQSAVGIIGPEWARETPGASCFRGKWCLKRQYRQCSRQLAGLCSRALEIKLRLFSAWSGFYRRGNMSPSIVHYLRNSFRPALTFFSGSSCIFKSNICFQCPGKYRQFANVDSDWQDGLIPDLKTSEKLCSTNSVFDRSSKTATQTVRYVSKVSMTLN